MERRDAVRLREPGVPLTTAALDQPATPRTWGSATPGVRRTAGTVGPVAGSEDRELVASLRAGDERAFVGLVDGWSGWMLRLARAHVTTGAAAEDVVQETWLAVVSGLDAFCGDAPLRTWVLRILVDQAERRGSKDRRTMSSASSTCADSGPTVDPARFQGAGEEHPGHWRESPDPWPEHVGLTREVHEVVSESLAELPERQRDVVALRDLEGHTAEEVQALLDISAGDQRVLLHRGRAAVRARLERYFATSPRTASEAE